MPRYVVTVLVHLNLDVVVDAPTGDEAEDAVLEAMYERYEGDVALADVVAVEDFPGSRDPDPACERCEGKGSLWLGKPLVSINAPCPACVAVESDSEVAGVG